MLLELDRGKVSRGGAYALAHARVLRKPASLTVGGMGILVVRQIHLLLFDRGGVWAGLSDFSHADPDLGALKELDVVGTRVLHTLKGVMLYGWETA